MVLNEDYQVAVPTAFYEDETLNLKATLQHICLLYTSDAADEEDSVDLGGRRIIKKKKKRKKHKQKKKKTTQQNT